MFSIIPRSFRFFVVVALSCAAIQGASGSTALAQGLSTVHMRNTDVERYIAAVNAQLAPILAEKNVCQDNRVLTEIDWLDAQRKITGNIMAGNLQKDIDALEAKLLAEASRLKALPVCFPSKKKTKRPKGFGGIRLIPRPSTPPR